MSISLTIIKEVYAIYQYPIRAGIPDWIQSSAFFSVTKTEDELSIVAIQHDLQDDQIKVSKDWRIIKVIGPLDFSLVGIIAGIATILKEEKISIFTISTYNTDYILVKKANLDQAIKALQSNNYNLENHT